MEVENLCTYESKGCLDKKFLATNDIGSSLIDSDLIKVRKIDGPTKPMPSLVDIPTNEATIHLGYQTQNGAQR